MKKLNILVVLPWLPTQMTSGGNQAMYNGLKAIENEVNLYITCNGQVKRKCITEQFNQLQSMLPHATIIPYYEKMTKKFFLIKLWKHFYQKYLQSTEEFEVEHMYDYLPSSNDFLEHVNKIIKEYSIDIVQTEMLRMASLVYSLPANIRSVFVHHELGYIRNSQYCETNSKPYIKTTARLAHDSEINILNNYDAIITLSNIDADKLRKEGVTASLYPSIAIINTDAINAINVEESHVLTFVGPEGHFPNKAGMQWFLDNCWNDLLSIDSNYKLKIIGNWTELTKRQIKLKYKNIEFLGFVENLSDSIRNSIMIVPITIGSGIRMKILEAASMGVPFVCTNVGVEGLPFTSGVDCLKTDEPMEFINNIIKLQNKDLRYSFAVSARNLVLENYTIKALCQNRLNIYNIISNKSGV